MDNKEEKSTMMLTEVQLQQDSNIGNKFQRLG